MQEFEELTTEVQGLRVREVVDALNLPQIKKMEVDISVVFCWRVERSDRSRQPAVESLAFGDREGQISVRLIIQTSLYNASSIVYRMRNG